MNERKKYAQLQVINEGAKLSEVREAPIEPAETKKDKNKKNIYLHLIRFLIRSDQLLNPNCGRSAIGVEKSMLIPSNTGKFVPVKAEKNP